MCDVCVKQAQNQERAVSWATWLKTEFRGHLARNAPLFVVSKPQIRQWSLGGAGGQPGLRMLGANGGSTSIPGAKKIIFSKVVPRPFGKGTT